MLDQANSFLDHIFHTLEQESIDLRHWEIDHLCYRTETPEEYTLLRESLTQVGELLSEEIIGGRPILTFRLFQPIRYHHYVINLIEVPAPKAGSPYKSGFEHIEVVIDEAFHSLDVNHNRVKKSNNLLNPELVLIFDDFSIKLHHKSLEHVINIENDKLVMNFLNESDILSSLKNYTPCISGTRPLGIHHNNSDLDILFCASDLSQFKGDVEQLYQSYDHFQVKETTHQGHYSVVINFSYKNLDIELFCQNLDSFQQQSNKHFLIEGRIIKLLGTSFKNKVQEMKKQGVKTEEAFGQLLGLKSPYDDLLSIYKLSDSELLDFLAWNENLL